MKEINYTGTQNFDKNDPELLESISEFIRNDALRYERILDTEEDLNDD